jgi:hypothetical protein
MIKVRDCIPKDWTKLIGNGPIGLGLDPATTEKDTSNPSSVTVMEKAGPLYVQRFVLRWKTSKEEVTRGMMRVIFEDLTKTQLRPRKLCIDATNERFFAQRLQKMFTIYCPVQLIVASEGVEHGGESFDYKTLLGNIYVNDFSDSIARMPDNLWLRDDHRLVKKKAGRFVADVAPDGSHADTFDSAKLARFALEGSGRAEASAVAVGSVSAAKQLPNGLRNPLFKMAQQQHRRSTHA